jgi:hypothetical protein
VPIDVSHAEIIWMKFDEWVEEVIADLPDLNLTRDEIISIISGAE